MGLYAAVERRSRQKRADYIEDVGIATNDGKAAVKRVKTLRAD